ncbi:hypothetical protein EJ03DRAFT_181411 [Teratosphaeria nubilosa]|uniref:Uncharacterized protein n=1 Tax=Teratosphaeria nubilosa TaxID=161662 RepID=A0A6G1L0C9_9PEZI|nr:hypothetical protein EJ03DRAFT_181411 [Teratosphaeria nubilosa]
MQSSFYRVRMGSSTKARVLWMSSCFCVLQEEDESGDHGDESHRWLDGRACASVVGSGCRGAAGAVGRRVGGAGNRSTGANSTSASGQSWCSAVALVVGSDDRAACACAWQHRQVGALVTAKSLVHALERLAQCSGRQKTRSQGRQARCSGRQKIQSVWQLGRCSARQTTRSQERCSSRQMTRVPERLVRCSQ